MSAHHLILAAAQRISAERGAAPFSPDDIVRALPQLNAQTVRTHVTSRCCVNARPHHQSRLEYFRKIGRGQYELLPQHRLARRTQPKPSAPDRDGAPLQRDTVHAVVVKDGGIYVVECHEIAVVTQGLTLDEALANLTEAVTLHLEGEDLSALGLDGLRRIHVSYDLPADVSAA